ncbi:MAG: helix-turn-helix domain-containing protein [Clostridiales bacterium]|jgi:transcriptional regulator with XRE-family HTH domain|nr:helix-turn-helix domain-containing protein [Clostridiales bacterium]
MSSTNNSNNNTNSTLTFGSFLTQRRKRLELQMKDFAADLSFTTVYICDIEKNRRPAPAPIVLEKMCKLLSLYGEDKYLFYDLAANTRNSVSADLKDYIMGNDVVRLALRKAKELGATEEEWREFLERLYVERGVIG